VIDLITRILTESWLVFGEMAPYLWLGFLVAGLLSVWVSAEWMERHLGGRGMGPVFKASLFGVPLPLCSCGVIPVSASLRRHGASRGATTAFLLSTPQTGVDSILVTHAMLGPLFAIYRPLVALLTGVLGGGLVSALDESPAERTAAEGNGEIAAQTKCNDDCCSADPRQGTWRRALKYGLITLPRDIGTALLIGVLIAGALSALVPPGSLTAYLGSGLVSILLLMVAGVPLYVCATASVPIAAGFMHMGASPGAALAFLIAGPATNAATITTVLRVMGRRTTVIYLLTVALSAVGCGLLLNWIAPRAAAAIPQLTIHTHGTSTGGLLFHLVAIAMLLVLLNAYLDGAWSRRRAERAGSQSAPLVGPATPGEGPAQDGQVQDSPAQVVQLAITGMNCSHCSESVRRAINDCSGVDSVDVDLDRSRATIRGTNLDPDAMVQIVSSLGYQAALAETTTTKS
jgi:uncharacterized membrane protein YraQ (UPF0718 family)/copper chaperone CopZ